MQELATRGRTNYAAYVGRADITPEASNDPRPDGRLGARPEPGRHRRDQRGRRQRPPRRRRSTRARGRLADAGSTPATPTRPGGKPPPPASTEQARLRTTPALTETPMPYPRFLLGLAVALAALVTPVSSRAGAPGETAGQGGNAALDWASRSFPRASRTSASTSTSTGRSRWTPSSAIRTGRWSASATCSTASARRLHARVPHVPDRLLARAQPDRRGAEARPLDHGEGVHGHHAQLRSARDGRADGGEARARSSRRTAAPRRWRIAAGRSSSGTTPTSTASPTPSASSTTTSSASSSSRTRRSILIAEAERTGGPLPVRPRVLAEGRPPRAPRGVQRALDLDDRSRPSVLLPLRPERRPLRPRGHARDAGRRRAGGARAHRLPRDLLDQRAR